MKKCAVINDLSGFGKCSLGVALPIISVMGFEVHPLLTAALSNQTGYSSFKSAAMTEHMNTFVAEWEKLNPFFDCILTGYVADERQLDIIDSFIDKFKKDKTVLIVDPVMADGGTLYSGYTQSACDKIRRLCFRADIITPNISELAFLAGEKYSETLGDIIAYGKKLIDMGMKSIVATGFKENGKISNIIFERNGPSIVSAAEKGGYYSGTGDILSSIIAGGIMCGMSLKAAVELGASFIEKAVAATTAENHCDGIAFEKILKDLA